MSFGANPLHFLVSKCNFIVQSCASGVFARAENFWLMVEHRSDLAKKAAPLDSMKYLISGMSRTAAAWQREAIAP
jgi:hypothetical protein